MRRFTSRSGLELALLVERDRGPAFWPNVYATADYLRRGASVNTSVKVLRTLGMARMWATALGRDLDHDLTDGPFLSLADVESLADFLRLSAASQDARASFERAPAPLVPSVLRQEDFRPDPKALAQPNEQAADPTEAATRIRWVAAYVEWHLQRRLGDLARRTRDASALLSLGEAVLAQLRSLAPRTQSQSDDEVSLEGVPREVLARIEEALSRGGPENPFHGAFVQARNYLYWRLLLDTGARRDEARQVKVDDVQYSTRRLRIRASKTLPRTVPIGPQTAEAFDRFMHDHWSYLPQAARKRGYLFTDEGGQHLSVRACNRIFERVREEVTGVPDFLSPHTLRRSWNDAFSAKIDALPPEKRPSVKQEVEMRNRLQGWSGKSSMGARYARRHLKKKADEIADELANSLLIMKSDDNE